MNMPRDVLTALISMTLLVGCGGSDAPTGSAAQTLTRAQLRNALGAMSGTLVKYTVASTDIRAHAGPTALRSAALALTGTFPCKDGGDLFISADAGSASATVVHRGCKVRGDDGTLWTFDGDPSVVYRVASFTATDSTLGFTLGVVGGTRVSTVGASVSCAMDLALATTLKIVAIGEPVVTIQASGTACGLQVNDTL
jgi:hypothetical protein